MCLVLPYRYVGRVDPKYGLHIRLRDQISNVLVSKLVPLIFGCPLHFLLLVWSRWGRASDCRWNSYGHPHFDCVDHYQQRYYRSFLHVLWWTFSKGKSTSSNYRSDEHRHGQPTTSSRTQDRSASFHSKHSSHQTQIKWDERIPQGNFPFLLAQMFGPDFLSRRGKLCG